MREDWNGSVQQIGRTPNGTEGPSNRLLPCAALNRIRAPNDSEGFSGAPSPQRGHGWSPGPNARTMAATTDNSSYLIPSAPVAAEQVVRRSRFIAHVGPAADRTAAESFIQSARDRYPDATHHCYAFIAGQPGNTPHVGLSDDREPHGTAGKPMMNVLEHSGIGEVVAVVTRYFGGTKLGTGGLARAYSSSVQLALERLELTEKTELVRLTFDFTYACEDAVRRHLGAHDLDAADVAYGERVTFIVDVPAATAADLRRQLDNVTNGQVGWHGSADPDADGSAKREQAPNGSTDSP